MVIIKSTIIIVTITVTTVLQLNDKHKGSDTYGLDGCMYIYYMVLCIMSYDQYRCVYYKFRRASTTVETGGKGNDGVCNSHNSSVETEANGEGTASMA